MSGPATFNLVEPLIRALNISLGKKTDEELIQYLESFAGERAAAKLQNRTFWNPFYYEAIREMETRESLRALCQQFRSEPSV